MFRTESTRCLAYSSAVSMTSAYVCNVSLVSLVSLSTMAMGSAAGRPFSVDCITSFILTMWLYQVPANSQPPSLAALRKSAAARSLVCITAVLAAARSEFS
ncbi:hypothetical protein D9M69_736170 [compost metagenome]